MIEQVKYHNLKTLTGHSGSTYSGVCDVGEIAIVQATFIEAIDGNDETFFSLSMLQCSEFEWDYLNNDAACGKCAFTAHFIPAWQLLTLKPNQPFRRRIQYGSQSFTLKGGLVKWGDGTVIAAGNIGPLYTISLDEITLFGTRQPQINLSTYDGYRDSVNSDVFMGIPDEQCLYRGAAAEPKVMQDGTMADDVQIRLTARGVSWNQDFREETGQFEAITINGNPKFASAAFSPLLS